MKLLALALLATFCLDEKAELNKACPDLTVKDLAGKEIKLSELKGKVVMIHFWSYKCPSGKAILADLKEKAAKCEKEGIVFVGVCAYGETQDQLKKFHADNEIAYTLCFDDGYRATKLFDAKVVTSTYILDKEGKLVYRAGWEGAMDAALAANQGKAIEKNDTKAKG